MMLYCYLVDINKQRLTIQTEYSSTLEVTFVGVTLNYNKSKNENTILSEQFLQSNRKIS